MSEENSAPIEPQTSEGVVVHEAPADVVEQHSEEAVEASEQLADQSDGQVEELSEDEKRRLGAAAAAARKREAAKWEAKLEEERRKNSMQQGAYVTPEVLQANNMVQDPITGEYHLAHSPVGQVILRDMRIQQKQVEQKQAAEHFEKQQKAEHFRETMADAHAKYADFDKAYAVVDHPTNGATVHMAQALLDVDAPAAIVNFLGKNPAEIARIRSLSPAQQRKEIYKLEDRLQPAPKLSTKAPAAVRSASPLRNTVASPENATIDQRVAQLREKYFGGRK